MEYKDLIRQLQIERVVVKYHSTINLLTYIYQKAIYYIIPLYCMYTHMSDSRPSFNMTRDQIDHFPIIFTKNIQEFKNNPDNKDERLTLFYLKETRNTILDLLVDNNIDKVNERLNKAWPKEAAVIQQTINDIKSIIENEDPNIKVTQEFKKIVSYIEKKSQDCWGKALFIESEIQSLENYIKSDSESILEGHDETIKINKELHKNIKLLELIKTFYKNYLEKNPLQTHNDTWEKRDGKFVVIGKKSKSENQNWKPRNL